MDVGDLEATFSAAVPYSLCRSNLRLAMPRLPAHRTNLAGHALPKPRAALVRSRVHPWQAFHVVVFLPKGKMDYIEQGCSTTCCT